jgi:hypothetical protein
MAFTPPRGEDVYRQTCMDPKCKQFSYLVANSMGQDNQITDRYRAEQLYEFRKGCDACKKSADAQCELYERQARLNDTNYPYGKQCRQKAVFLFNKADQLFRKKLDEEEKAKARRQQRDNQKRLDDLKELERAIKSGGESKFKRRVGSAKSVYQGYAQQTSGGLRKGDLMKNKHGRIVSIKKHEQGLRMFQKNKSYLLPQMERMKQGLVKPLS